MKRCNSREAAPLTVRTSDRGFTLVEVMVVIAILGIAMAIAVPSFTQLIANQRVRGLADDLHGALMLARSAAITRNAPVVMEATDTTEGWTSGWSIYPDGDSTNVLRTHESTSGLGITSGATSLTFRSNGRVDAAATISFEVESEAVSGIKRCVRIDPSGRPRIAEGACS